MAAHRAEIREDMYALRQDIGTIGEDMKALRGEFRQDMQAFRSEFREGTAELRADMRMWTAASIGLSAAIAVGAIGGIVSIALVG